MDSPPLRLPLPNVVDDEDFTMCLFPLLTCLATPPLSDVFSIGSSEERRKIKFIFIDDVKLHLFSAVQMNREHTEEHGQRLERLKNVLNIFIHKIPENNGSGRRNRGSGRHKKSSVCNRNTAVKSTNVTSQDKELRRTWALSTWCWTHYWRRR